VKRFEFVAEEKNPPHNATDDRRLYLDIQFSWYPADMDVDEFLRSLREEIERRFRFSPRSVVIRELGR
jgi:hypothetical protein